MCFHCTSFHFLGGDLLISFQSTSDLDPKQRRTGYQYPNLLQEERTDEVRARETLVCIRKTATRHKRGERDVGGTGFLFEEPNPTGSRPSDLIGLYRKWQPRKKETPTGEKEQKGRGGGVWHGILFEEPNPTGSRPSDLIGLYKLFKRETEHLH